MAAYTQPFYFNPIFAGAELIFLAQALVKNKYSGITLALLSFLLNFLFMGAVLSEFNEFNEFDQSAQLLLLVGSSIFLVNGFFIVVMIYKYARLFASKSQKNKLTLPL